MALAKWSLLLLSAVALRADTVTISSGPVYVSGSAGSALSTTSDPQRALTLERLYAGNGYFYLRWNGVVYIATNPVTGALALAAPGTASAEQFQTIPVGAGVNLEARSTSGYVAIAGGSLVANASAAQAASFTLNAAAGAAARVEVDFANPRQQIAGFGAADAFYTNWLTAHPNKEQIYALLFGRDNLGASILRVQNIYGQVSTSASFDPDTAEVVAKANSYRGSPITVLMSSWSPPGSLKASGQVSCNGASVEPGCTLAKVNGAFNYAGFAQYWYDSLNAYATLGVQPDFISLQNEPDFTPSGYGGCRFDPAEQSGGTYAGYREALDATYSRLRAMPNPPALVGPEVLGLGYSTIEHYVSALSGSELAQMAAVAHHLYHGGDSGAPDTFNGSMLQLAGAAPSSTLWETEFDHSADQTTAMDTAWLIHNAMATEEASAYLYWSYFWPDTNQLVYIDNPFAPSGWQYPSVGYHLNDYYYAVEHFSRFVQPGFQRFAALTGLVDLRATAYYDRRQRRLVYVLVNTSATATLTPALTLPQSTATVYSSASTSAPLGFRTAQGVSGPSAVYRSTFSGASERFASLGALGADGVVTLPPQSVATIVLDDVYASCRASSRICGTPLASGR